MIIQEIKINGFKDFAESTQNMDQNILALRGDRKRFVFGAILGIIFGLSKEEKIKLKSDQAKIFTGSLIFRFNNIKLHFDRDFETDIVAVLSKKNNKWTRLFQGKDNPEMQEREYSDLLNSFFVLTDRDFIRHLLYDKLNEDRPTLGELIDYLYLLLNSKFKIAAINLMIKESRDHLNKLQEISKKNGSTSEQNLLEQNRDLLKKYKKIAQTIESLRSDISFYKNSMEKLNIGTEKSISSNEILKQRFPLIYQMDASVVKNEVYELINLRKESSRISKHINKYREKKAELENLLKKYLIYSELPESFENEFKSYQQLSVDLAHERNLYDQYLIKIEKVQTEYKERRKIGLTILLTVPFAIALSMFIFLPENLIYSIILFIVSATAIIFLTRLGTHKLYKDIDRHQIILAERRRKIAAINKKIKDLNQKSVLFDDIDYIDTHIKKFKEYKEIQKRLDILKHEIILLEKTLRDKDISKTLDRYEKKYKDLIDLNREDLVDYISGFEQLQKEQTEDSIDYERKYQNKMQKSIERYQKLIIDLETIKSSIESNCGLDGTKQDADSKIITLEKKIQLNTMNITID